MVDLHDYVNNNNIVAILSRQTEFAVHCVTFQELANNAGLVYFMCIYCLTLFTYSLEKIFIVPASFHSLL